MLSAIIWLAVFCCSALISFYLLDEPKYLEDPPVETRRPSVFDLPEKADRYMVDKYINEHIIPAERYFSLRDEFGTAGDASNIMIQFIMIIAPALMFILSIYKYSKGLHGLITTLLLCVAGAAVCFLLAWLLHKLYSRSWKVEKMYIDAPYLDRQLTHLEDDFKVGHAIAQENYMTLMYCAYCNKISKTMRKRIALKSVVSGICAVIYLLFFFKNPY